MKDSLVSVLVPAYNHENYIQETIKSVINQTYYNIELIIVDDGSNDLTWQRICDMDIECEKRFIRVIFKKQENQGTCRTLNKLISLTNGEYVYIIASDDVSKPNAIKTEVEFLENNLDYDFVVGDDEFIDPDGKQCYLDKNKNIIYDVKQASFLKFSDIYRKRKPFLFGKNFGKYETLCLGNYIPNGYLIRRSIFDKIGPFKPEAPLEDWWLHLQISKYSKMKFLDKILFSYRQHDKNTAKNLEKMHNMANKTLEYEYKFINSITDKTGIDPAVFDIQENGILYKRFGIKYIFEKLNFVRGNIKIKVIKIFNITIFKNTRNIG